MGSQAYRLRVLQNCGQSPSGNALIAKNVREFRSRLFHEAFYAFACFPQAKRPRSQVDILGW